MSIGPLVLLNDLPIVDMRLGMPRVGAWTCDVSVDTTVADTPPTFNGKVTLNVDGTTLAGAVRRGGLTADVTVLRLVAGAGGLATVVTPKSYVGVTPQVVLSDLMAASGETLATTIDPSLLSQPWAFWTSPAWPVGRLLGEVASRMGSDVVWRILPDGTVWLGRETWPTVAPSVVRLSRDDLLNRTRYQLLDSSFITPGTVVDGAKVDYALVEGRDGARLTAEVWLQ